MRNKRKKCTNQRNYLHFKLILSYRFMPQNVSKQGKLKVLTMNVEDYAIMCSLLIGIDNYSRK